MTNVDYRKPGAYTEESPTPGTPAPIFRPAVVAILGRVKEAVQSTTAEVVRMNTSIMSEDATPILNYKVQLNYDRCLDNANFKVVSSYSPPVTYEQGTDYTVDFYTGIITLLTIDPPVPDTAGTWLNVTYDHLPRNFYTPRDFFDYDDVVDFYGDPLDANGEVQSPLVLACGFALQNGPWIKAFPVDPACGDIINHIDNTIGTEDWEYTIQEKLTLEDVDIVVGIYECDESSYQQYEAETLYGLMDDHLADTCSETGRLERVWMWSDMYGMDVFDAAYADMENKDVLHAWGMSREEEIYVCPPGAHWYNYRKINPETNVAGVSVPLDGNYLCAFLAGLMASYDPQMPLTFKKVYNFHGMGDTYKEDEMNLLATKGCTVMEELPWGLRVRHGVTCNLERLENTEISVVRAKHYMCKYLRQRLEEQFVGQPINGTTFLSVASQTYAMLILLKSAGVIYDFQNVKARANPNMPTEVIVKFEYCPAYPLNYILIQFTINPQLLTSQTAEATVAGGTQDDTTPIPAIS